jgi:hypothetical protein
MKSDLMSWLDGAEAAEVAEGSVVATLAMSGEAWSRSSARFIETDDGDGEQPGLAVGRVAVGGHPAQFAVLDYGDAEITYLVVGGEYSERLALTERVIDGLIGAGAIPVRSCVLEVVGRQDELNAGSHRSTSVGADHSERSTTRHVCAGNIARARSAASRIN